ncbi:hypothetical protein SAMN02927924_01940 [Sphingobium faniae]|nr:hypothetical protein SAMN02927924_01940 [Sphingobium faniae]
MAKSMMLALSNPVSKEREQEFNDWYDNVHAVQLLALPGINRVRRYKAVRQMLPPSDDGTPTYRYLAVYDVDDADAAITTILENDPTFDMSDSMNFEGAFGVAFEQIFESGGTE